MRRGYGGLIGMLLLIGFSGCVGEAQKGHDAEPSTTDANLTQDEQSSAGVDASHITVQGDSEKGYTVTIDDVLVADALQRQTYEGQLMAYLDHRYETIDTAFMQSNQAAHVLVFDHLLKAWPGAEEAIANLYQRLEASQASKSTAILWSILLDQGYIELPYLDEAFVEKKDAAITPFLHYAMTSTAVAVDDRIAAAARLVALGDEGGRDFLHQMSTDRTYAAVSEAVRAQLAALPPSDDISLGVLVVREVGPGLEVAFLEEDGTVWDVLRFGDAEPSGRVQVWRFSPEDQVVEMRVLTVNEQAYVVWANESLGIKKRLSRRDTNLIYLTWEAYLTNETILELPAGTMVRVHSDEEATGVPRTGAFQAVEVEGNWARVIPLDEVGQHEAPAGWVRWRSDDDSLLVRLLK